MGKSHGHSISERLRYRSRSLHFAYASFFSHFDRSLNLIRVILEALTEVTSLVCLVSLIVYVGYDLSPNDVRAIMSILRVTQAIFCANVLYQLVFFFRKTISESRIIRRIVDTAILVSLLLWIIPHQWLPWAWTGILYTNKLLFLVLGSYSLVELCYAISRIPGRRTNPSLLLGLSFLSFIIVGSFVLMLPRCTYCGISYFDSLFIASSAVSITGLTPVDVSATFTPLGLLVLSVLIQLGSLGIITFTSFFALFFTGNSSIYNQLLLRDVVYSKSMNALVPTLLYVLGFTLVIEIIGAACVYFTIPDSLGLDVDDKLIFACFHAMSSFCNAGFSCIPDGMANPALMHSNQVIYIVTSVLIFAGAVGFPILANFKEIIKSKLLRIGNRIGITGTKSRTLPVHIYDLNTKLVLYTTLIILVVGSVGFFVLEYDNTLRGMDLYERIVQSVFNALIPRSAGFASVNPASFLDITILLVLVQMVIGGSSQSMAGGIKVNTFGAVILNLKAVILGHRGTTAFKRTLNPASIRRANAVVIIAAFAFISYLSAVMLIEPHLPSKSLVFEVVSALFTVGSSLGITAELSDASKVVLSSAMFLGRVGILSLLAGFAGSRRDVSDHYPIDSIIIN